MSDSPNPFRKKSLQRQTHGPAPTTFLKTINKYKPTTLSQELTVDSLETANLDLTCYFPDLHPLQRFQTQKVQPRLHNAQCAGTKHQTAGLYFLFFHDDFICIVEGAEGARELVQIGAELVRA